MTKWVFGFIVLFVALSMFNGVVDASIDTTGTKSALETLVTESPVDTRIDFTPFVNTDWLNASAAMITFDFPNLYNGDWAYFRYYVLWPLSAAFAFSLLISIASVVRGGGGSSG